MDTDNKLVHLPLSVQMLITASAEAWDFWDHRPSRSEMIGQSEKYRLWEMEYRDKMNILGVYLLSFGRITPSGRSTE